MPSIVRSARGELVDFDLLKIQQQLQQPNAIEVKTRQDYIDKRQQRREHQITDYVEQENQQEKQDKKNTDILTPKSSTKTDNKLQQNPRKTKQKAR